MTLTLFAHQRTMLDLLTEHDRFLMLAEQGTMKTLPFVIHLSNLLMAGEITDALVVAPLSGLDAWYRDIEGVSPERQRLIRRYVTFINWDKLSRTNGSWQRKCWHDWGAVVLDEGHAIKRPGSNRTQYFIGKGKRLGLTSLAKHFYLLTGTLISNSKLENAWAPLRAVLGDSWEYYRYADFERHFLVTTILPGTYTKIVRGYRHRDELLALVASVSYRVLKKDCLDLPKVQPDEVITVPWATGTNTEPFHATTKKLYDDALDSYVEALDMVSDNPLTRMLRLRQIAAGHIKESDTVDERGHTHRGHTYALKSDKVRYAMEVIERRLPAKVVVGYQFTATCTALEAALTKARIPYVMLNGAAKDKSVWRRFQSDDRIKVIVVQYQSGAQSIDLYASSCTIFMEPSDSSTITEQFRARTDRQGQTESCEYIWLLTAGSIEVDMYDRLQKHQDFSEKAYREIAQTRRGER